MSEIFDNCWYLSGPTASGKSSVGIALARSLGAEIISLDSMAVYRGMDIGTATPTVAEQDGIPHHLIDIIDPIQEYSVSQYLEDAERIVGEIRSHGHEVLFVGGTPLYLKTLLRGLFEGPSADWEFRRQVEQEVAQIGTSHLHERLQQVDPLSAAKLHPNDVRRIIRALEVYKITGEPLSHQQTQFEQSRDPHECKVFVLDRPRAQLYDRINQRVVAMYQEGLVGEVQHLLNTYPQLGRTAAQAVGYCETIAHIREGVDLEQTITDVKTKTRQFAKRQLTWFRRLEECRFVPVAATDTPKETAARVVEMV